MLSRLSSRSSNIRPFLQVPQRSVVLEGLERYEPSALQDELFKKSKRAPEDMVVPNMENKLEFWAKKVRQSYLDAGAIQWQKSYIHPLRIRKQEDELIALKNNKEVPCCVMKREEFPDLDLVLKQRVGWTMYHEFHKYLRPWYIKMPEGEEIRVNLQDIQMHVVHRFPIKIWFQRYIEGRPNLLKIPLRRVLEDSNPYGHLGCQFRTVTTDLWVWCYTDRYPGMIEIDYSLLTPRWSWKIGDVEKLLPEGMYLHRKHHRMRHQAVAKIVETPVYQALGKMQEKRTKERKRLEEEAVEEVKKEAETAGRNKREIKQKQPRVTLSSKRIMHEIGEFAQFFDQHKNKYEAPKAHETQIDIDTFNSEGGEDPS